MRINQYVAQTSGISRRAADEAVSQGRVRVADHIAVLGEDVDAGDVVKLDGQKLVSLTTHTYVLFNKPPGYVSSRTQQGNSPTLYALLPPQMHKLRITGRLDRQSSGLMLLTDDGDFIQRHTHPSFEKLKVYEVTLPRPLHQAERDRLEAGIELKDGLSRLTVVLQVGRTVTLSMHEGRNRQIRRTFAELGLEVERLHRIQMGPYAIGELAPGTWRVMTREELS